MREALTINDLGGGLGCRSLRHSSFWSLEEGGGGGGTDTKIKVSLGACSKSWGLEQWDWDWDWECRGWLHCQILETCLTLEPGGGRRRGEGQRKIKGLGDGLPEFARGVALPDPRDIPHSGAWR